MAAPTTRRHQISCLGDSSNFQSATVELHRTAPRPRHARTASMPVAHQQPGHQRSRSWLTSFMKAEPPTVEESAPRDETRRRRTNSLGASLKRKMRNLGVTPTELENLPPPRPAPPTLLPDTDMAALRLPRATVHPHRFSLSRTPTLVIKPRNASWDWDGGEGNQAAAVTRRGGHKTMSLDGGVTAAGARAAKAKDGRLADLGSIWEAFTEDFDEGEVITFDLPPPHPPLKDRKASVSSRRVPVPTFLPFPSAVTPTESLFDPLDVSGQLSQSVANTSTSHLDLDGFPSPPPGSETRRFEDEQERLQSGDEEEYVWNPALLPSRQSSLASRRDRALPPPLVIDIEPLSAFDEPTPSPTGSHSVYSVDDDELSPQQQQRSSYFSPVTPTFPIDSTTAYSPTSLQPSSSPVTFNRGGRSADLISPRSSIPTLHPPPVPTPQRSPILEGLAITSSGLITPPKHQRHGSSSSPLALRTLKALPPLPAPSAASSIYSNDEDDVGPSRRSSPLANSLPFSHTSFLSPFAAAHSPSSTAPSVHLSPRSSVSRPSPPRVPIPFSSTSRNLSASLSSSVGGLSSEIGRQDAYAREEVRRSSKDSPLHNPSPRLPSSSIFTATTRFGDDFSPYQQSVSSFETRASSVHSMDEGRRIKDDEEMWSIEDSDGEGEADTSRVRGEKWIEREMSGDWAGRFEDEEVSDEEDGEETLKVETYTRRELERREEERRIRYAKERASLYAEPGPDDALYVYGVAM